MEATPKDHIDPKDVEVVFLDAGGVLLYPDWERVSRILSKYGIKATSVQLADATRASQPPQATSPSPTATSDGC